MKRFLSDIHILHALWRVVRARDFFLGTTIRQFEKSLAEFVKSRYAIGVSSGTDALILSLKALGVGHGDEVIVPAVSFVGTASAVSWVGATPVFVDIEEHGRTIDPRLVEKAITSKTRVIVPVHLDGRMADMDAILALGKKYGVSIIADSAHAIGSHYKGRAIGELGDTVCLSFSFTKPFGSYGNAGAILTNDAALHEKLLPFRMYGARSKKEIYSGNIAAAGSHRLDSFQAAVLNCKLHAWSSLIQRQKRYCDIYTEMLSGVRGITLPESHADHDPNGFRFTIRASHKKELLIFLSRSGIRLADYYGVPLPYLPIFTSLGHKTGDFPVAETFARESVALPTNPDMLERHIRRIARLVRGFYIEK